jgi:hypothetical protein
MCRLAFWWVEMSGSEMSRVTTAYYLALSSAGIQLKALKLLFMKRRPLFICPLISPTMWM